MAANPRPARDAAMLADRAIIGRRGRLSYLLGRLCDRVPGLFYARHRIVSVDARDLPSIPRGHAVRALLAGELAGHRIDADAAVQAQRFAAGMTCLGAFNAGGALVGVAWLGAGSHDETLLGVRFRLPPGAAWDGGLWIDEERRLSRAFVALWAGVRCWLEERGLDRTISSIADYNAGSIAAHRRLGARLIGHVAILRVGPVQLALCSGAAPRLTIRRRVPELALA